VVNVDNSGGDGKRVVFVDDDGCRSKSEDDGKWWVMLIVLVSFTPCRIDFE